MFQVEWGFIDYFIGNHWDARLHSDLATIRQDIRCLHHDGECKPPSVSQLKNTMVVVRIRPVWTRWIFWFWCRSGYPSKSTWRYHNHPPRYLINHSIELSVIEWTITDTFWLKQYQDVRPWLKRRLNITTCRHQLRNITVVSKGICGCQPIAFIVHTRRYEPLLPSIQPTKWLLRCCNE